MSYQIAATGTRDIKRALYELLKVDVDLVALVGTRVRIHSEGREVAAVVDQRLPEITIGRISTKVEAVSGLRIDVMQVSAWSMMMSEAELITHHIARVLNRAKNDTFRACVLESINDSHDPSSKAYGIHSTYRIACLDQKL